VKLHGVKTVDVLGVPNGSYSFAKSDGAAHDVVFLTGGSGAGKTRFLEMIVAARDLLTTGEREPHGLGFIRPGNRSSKVVLSWELDEEERTAIGAKGPVVATELIFQEEEEDDPDARMRFLMERYAHDDDTPKFEYFSERRRLDVGGGGASLDESEQLFLRVDSSPRKFSWVPAFLEELPDRPESAARFADLVGRLSASAAYDVSRHVLTSKGRALGDLQQLTASEADAVMFASTATLVGLSRSIVLIDRPELHGLEPARAMDGLTALGANNQLILATASRAFVATGRGGVVELGPHAAR
jgi:hypothetical protein